MHYRLISLAPGFREIPQLAFAGCAMRVKVRLICSGVCYTEWNER